MQRFKKKVNIENEYQTKFDCRYFPFDHCSAAVAMQTAMEQLQNEAFEFCIVGGIESYMDQSTLTWLEEKGYLKCTHNKIGFIPGEAAGFCLLSTQKTAKKYGLSPLAEVIAIADSNEENYFGTQSVNLGQGLTQAIEHVLMDLPEGEKITNVYGDLNGQHYRSEEYAYAILRLRDSFSSPDEPVIAPANLWGDLGAATFPLLLGLVTEAGDEEALKNANCLVFTGSLKKQRAAALIKLKA